MKCAFVQTMLVAICIRAIESEKEHKLNLASTSIWKFKGPRHLYSPT